MTKLSFIFSVFFVLTNCTLFAQGYNVHYVSIDEDSVSLHKKINLQSSFSSRPEASAYVATLPLLLQSKGFITASVDSVAFDSSSAEVNIFFGEMYQWASIRTLPENEAFLQQLRWKPEQWKGNVNFKDLEVWQQKILDALEENGHPFGKVFLDSIDLDTGRVNALLQIKKGPTYKIDSIRVYGDVSVSNVFLQRYLDLPNGSTYNKKKLSGISKKLAELVYLQEERPSDLSLLGTGSVLNLYLLPKKSSQVNALIGFLPNSQRLSGEQKLLLTVDANVLLRNALGGGETIGLLWQQLQQSSPRLNLQFEQPFIFSSPFGLNFNFDMYRRDSIFLNLNMNLGASYRLSASKTGSIFLQRRQSIVSGFNEPLIIQTKQLPPEVDVSSLNLGIGYTTNTTDYRFNPRKGSDFVVTATAGTKSIKKNNAIVDLKDPGNPSFNFESLYDTVKLKAYQFRVTASLAHYLPLSRQTTFKLALNAGLFQSANYFRNELFQIGGYKLLRGFDEESQFVSQYAIGTLEYRYLIGQNSAFFVFVDGGWGRHLAELQKHHGYFGTGLGLSFETKAGIFNLAWAVGKRDDLPFNLRQSKVHLGFASYF
ncbi:MAG: BamA/TamA family outer membrane protein [Bacteroidota bacterium]